MNFIVKPHPFAKKFIEDKKLHFLSSKYNVHFCFKVSNYSLDLSVENYLKVTDCLISDISGTIVDFMILGKPVIFIEPDNELFKIKNSAMNWENTDLKPSFRIGLIANTRTELKEAIKTTLFEEDLYKIKRKNILKYIIGKRDGKRSEQAAKAILNYYPKFI